MLPLLEGKATSEGMAELARRQATRKTPIDRGDDAFRPRLGLAKRGPESAIVPPLLSWPKLERTWLHYRRWSGKGNRII